MKRRSLLLVGLALFVGGGPVLGQTSTPTVTPTPTPTLMQKAESKHGDTDFAAFEYGSFVLDPHSISAGTEFTVIIPGIHPKDSIIIYPPQGLEATLALTGWRIQTNNEVIVRLSPAGTVDGASRTWNYLWFDRTKPGQPVNTAVSLSTPTNTPTPTSTPTSTPTVTPTT